MDSRDQARHREVKKKWHLQHLVLLGKSVGQVSNLPTAGGWGRLETCPTLFHRFRASLAT
jgi:hypothetical protein